RSNSNLIATLSFADPGISDHLALLSELSFPIHTRPSRVIKSTRCFRSIDPAAFSLDIMSSSLLSSPPSSLDSYLSNFSSTLSALLDKHAPPKTVSYLTKTHKPSSVKKSVTTNPSDP